MIRGKLSVCAVLTLSVAGPLHAQRPVETADLLRLRTVTSIVGNVSGRCTGKPEGPVVDSAGPLRTPTCANSMRPGTATGARGGGSDPRSTTKAKTVVTAARIANGKPMTCIR